MPPKGKKSKAEEALDFLSNLDNLDSEEPSATESAPPPSAIPILPTSTPRASTDSTRPKSLRDPKTSIELASTPPPTLVTQESDEEAAKALAYLEAQIATKRAPLSQPARPATPNPVPPPPQEPINVSSTPAPVRGGWGVSSFWNTATSVVQSAQKIADEGYKRVKEEGVQSVTGLSTELDLGRLRKGAEERLGGIVKGVDLEKLRQDLLSNTMSGLTTILNTVAPPIGAHETLELWLSHPMIGYDGVEGVVYRAWTRILEQTESGELIVVWSPEAEEGEEKEGVEGRLRGLYPVEGWTEGSEKAAKAVEGIKAREEASPQGRGKGNPNVPVTTIPIFLHLQPLLAPLPFPEPPILLKADPTDKEPSKHLYFILTLHDPSHGIRFTTTTQPSPGDWLDVEYERSDWVEERLVEVLRTGVEIIAQDYVATRMGLKPSTGTTRPQSPVKEDETPVAPVQGEVKVDEASS